MYVTCRCLGLNIGEHINFGIKLHAFKSIHVTSMLLAQERSSARKGRLKRRNAMMSSCFLGSVCSCPAQDVSETWTRVQFYVRVIDELYCLLYGSRYALPPPTIWY